MTTSPTRRLRELGLALPPAATPSFDYVPVTQAGDVLYVSGQLPKEDGQVRITGRLGDDVDVETARRAARICVLQGLACAAEHVGDLDRVDRVLRITGFVASTPDFHDHPLVIDGASELVGQIFGDRGKHARSAVGVAALPRRSPVEIEFILAVATSGGTA
ncbi:RidA family protein [Jiangella gansuensis]|uniref:RidA family protein n=1 Tax=Jiangella gansuensis TaxID=281473 RepID=UPI00047ED9D3|nr:RidA family protein [Jiangella gansuensis]